MPISSASGHGLWNLQTLSDFPGHFTVCLSACVLPAGTLPSHVLLQHDKLLPVGLTCFAICLQVGQVGARLIAGICLL